MTREEAIRDIEECVIPYVGGISLRMAVEALKEQRPHGEWLKSDIPESLLAKCSICGFDCGAYTHNFCPNCGSDNRKSGEDTPKEHEGKKTKKCPNCGSDLYEYCFMCCYEGGKVRR